MRVRAILVVALLLGWGLIFVATSRTSSAYPLEGRYLGLPLQNCADPTITRAREADNLWHWYMYCTTDPLNDHDRDAAGNYRFRLIAILHSTDLVHWDYVGDVFSARPGWVASTISDIAGLWSPEVHLIEGTYYLYYTANSPQTGKSAIGVATSSRPTGPWVDSGGPVVEAQPLGDYWRWVYDPFPLTDEDGQLYLFYGSYVGGVSVRRLSPDGLRSDPASETLIAPSERYEGAFVRKRGAYYYLFVSATNCCNGPLTGYTVFAGRATDPLGPYVDRDGEPFLSNRPGGTVVISMNGNRWVGPGHNGVFTDFAGQDWFLYHAVDRGDPYFAGRPGFTKRAPLLDPLDWVDGWPTVRGGLWASEAAETSGMAPAAQPDRSGTYTPRAARADTPGELMPSLSDEFEGSGPGPQWHWVRPPAPAAFRVAGGALRFDTQAADLFLESNTASVLVMPAPAGDYVVETRVNLTVPPRGGAFNFVQAGLVIYGDDNNYVKLTHVAIGDTRQTEFAKEMSPVPPGYPGYGNTVVGPPAEWTYLRVVRRGGDGEERYTAYTSRDGATWTRGGTWTHTLGARAQIGLVSMGGARFTAAIDYVRVYTVAP